MTKRTCTIADCSAKHVARGLCRKHYNDDYADRFPSTPCNISGCDNRTTHKSFGGMCEKHCGRIARHGTPDALVFHPTRGQSLADILHARSKPHDDCIHWTGTIGPDGYGDVNRKTWGTGEAHRASYMLNSGPIPEGHEVDHLCHTADPLCVPSECLHRRCINPEHLEAVSREENMRRQVARLQQVA